MNKIAAIITNYNMPERADALAEYIEANAKWPVRLFVVDNGSDLCGPAKSTNVFLKRNRQTTGGWLAGLDAADSYHEDYLAYWFLITSAEFSQDGGDPITPMAELLAGNENAVGVHSALTPDSATHWQHLIARGGDQPRRTWMLDNISSLYRADWFNSIGRFDPAMIYGWGIDLETSYKAREQGRSLWVHEACQITKVTNIGYKMERMNMSADDRGRLAGENMNAVLREKYGPYFWNRMNNQFVEQAWR